MSYAVRNDGLGWRAVASAADVMEGEHFSLEQPEIKEPEREFKHFAPLDFLNLFTPERRAIKAAAMADVDVGIWYDDTVAARYITYSDDRTKLGVQALVGAGLLTQARHDEIVSALTAEREG